VLDIRPEFDAHCGTTVHLASEHTFARVNPYHVKEKGTITLIQECVGRYARHCGGENMFSCVFECHCYAP